MKTGVESNVSKVLQRFDASFKEYIKKTGRQQTALSTLAMDSIREKGLIKGEHKEGAKRQYEDIKVLESGIITQRRKSQKGRTKDLVRYKYYGKVRNRKNKYAERDRGLRSVKKVFHKSKIAVRTGNFYKIFEHKTSFNESGKKFTQTRQGAEISIENFDLNKDKTSQTITYKFFGDEGKSLRMLSHGKTRTEVFTLENGRQLKGKKGRRPILMNGFRRVYKNYNKLMETGLTEYKREFDRIK